MLGEDHSLKHEFPEYREQINQLAANDRHFANGAKRYDALDKQIRNLELAGTPVSDDTIHQMKHDRSVLKDSLYRRLQQTD